MKKPNKTERTKDAVVWALLEKKISIAQAIAQLQDIGFEYEDAKDYVDSLTGDE